VIVATAGHVDHGKTVLVKALTGVDTDRLAEEKRRGLSIDLGFAYAPLPDGSVLGFVDVPGHERFVRTMVAGVTGIDYALVVVAADDGPMPQTQEHLAILDLLGVSEGAVAVTKIDRTSRATVAETSAAVAALLSPNSLAGAALFPVSGITGEGLPALRRHLEEAAARVGERRAGGHFRLAIDRCFTIEGTGLVVTGTVFSGRVDRGDRLVLSPLGEPVRVRGIHAQNRAAKTGRAGERCALNIVGPDVSRATVHRGDWLLDERIHAPVTRLDAVVRVPAARDRPLKHWSGVHVHLGAADVTGRVALLEGRAIAPGGRGLVQVVLDHALGALKGDRFILRDRSARDTLAGGHVIDPFAPSRGRAKAERLALLGAMETDDPAAALARMLDSAAGAVDLSRFALAWNLAQAEADAVYKAMAMVHIQDAGGPVALSPRRWEALGRETLEAAGKRHRSAPERSGGTDEELRKALTDQVSPAVFASVVSGLVAEGALVRAGLRLRLPAHRPRMRANDAALWERTKPLLAGRGLRPPRLEELARSLGVSVGTVEKLLARAANLGVVFKVSANRFYLAGTLSELADIAEGLAAEAADGQFTVLAFRDRSGIGRNVSIEVLEFFDKSGFTVRLGNTRRIASNGMRFGI
jgi:selenocysteine-specific elongation factor